jgi:hypothetical protein
VSRAWDSADLRTMLWSTASLHSSRSKLLPSA